MFTVIVVVVVRSPLTHEAFRGAKLHSISNASELLQVKLFAQLLEGLLPLFAHLTDAVAVAANRW